MMKKTYCRPILLVAILWGLLAGLAQPAAAQFLWQRSVGTATNDETAEFMIPVAGGFLTLGKSSNQTTRPPQALYLSKVDYTGTLLWTKRQAFANVNVLYPRGLFADAAGNLVVSVITVAPVLSGQPAPFTQGLLVKFNALGDTLWTRRVSATSDATLGVPVLGNDGNYVVIGDLAASLPALFKFSPTGTLLWTQIMPYSGTRQGYLQNIVAVPNGYFLVSSPTVGNLKSKYVTVDEQGIYQFERLGRYYYPDQLRLDTQGSILAIGGDLTKLTVQGDSLWTRTYQQYNRVLGVTRLVELPNGNYLAAGIRYNATDNDVGLVLTDHNGIRLRDTLLVRYQSDENAAGVALTPAGDYVMALGSTQGTIGGADQALFGYRNWSRLLPTRPGQPALTALTAYPNPTSDEVRLVTAEGSAPAGTWLLCDMLGRIVQNGTLTGSPADGLSLRDQPPGLYLLRLTEAHSGTTHTLRLQKA